MKIIMKTVFGSHLYGLENPESDIDYKGIYLPELSELLLGTYKPYINLDTNKNGKNTSNDVDDEFIALPTFINLAIKGETVALDILHSTVAKRGIEYGHIWDDIIANKHLFLTKGLKAYIGYLKGQVHKYGGKGKKLELIKNMIEILKPYHSGRKLGEVWEILPTGKHLEKGINNDESRNHNTRFWSVLGAKYQETITIGYCIEQLEKKYNSYGHRARKAEATGGYDWKAISHAFRVGYQLLDIYNKGSFSYPLRQTDFIKEVKAGELDYKKVLEPMLNLMIEDIEIAAQASDFPEKVDREFWDAWLLKVYNNEFALGELWPI